MVFDIWVSGRGIVHTKQKKITFLKSFFYFFAHAHIHMDILCYKSMLALKRTQFLLLRNIWVFRRKFVLTSTVCVYQAEGI